MIEGEIVKEVRAARDAFAAAHGYDLRAMVAALRDLDERCVYYAINAVTRLTRTDVRDKPVEDMDIEKTRRKVLDMLRERK